MSPGERTLEEPEMMIPGLSLLFSSKGVSGRIPSPPENEFCHQISPYVDGQPPRTVTKEQTTELRRRDPTHTTGSLGPPSQAPRWGDRKRGDRGGGDRVRRDLERGCPSHWRALPPTSCVALGGLLASLSLHTHMSGHHRAFHVGLQWRGLEI